MVALVCAGWLLWFVLVGCWWALAGCCCFGNVWLVVVGYSLVSGWLLVSVALGWFWLVADGLVADGLVGSGNCDCWFWMLLVGCACFRLSLDAVCCWGLSEEQASQTFTMDPLLRLVYLGLCKRGIPKWASNSFWFPLRQPK